MNVAWNDYAPLSALGAVDDPDLVVVVNAALAESAAQLTAAVAACPDLFEQHVAHRHDSRRPVWHAIPHPHTLAGTATFVAEIHALIATLLPGLRNGLIAEPDARLRAYDAIDLAHWRAGQAQPLLDRIPRGLNQAA